MKRRAQNDPGAFAILCAATALMFAVMALPWIVEHGAEFIDAHLGFFATVACIGVCLFLALGAAIGGRLDRTSRGGAMDPSLPARMRGPRAPSGGPVRDSHAGGTRPVTPHFRKDFWS